MELGRRMTSMVSGVVFALALGLAWPSLAEAQRDIGELRVGGYLALGLGGDVDVTAGGFAGAVSLDPTVGFGLRAEVPLHTYFALGGMFELLFFEGDSRFWNEREAVFDFAIFPKVRYRVELTRSVSIEPYIGVPFGLSLAVLGSPSGSGDEVWPGFNTGVLAGAMLLLDQVGFLFELGWRHHQVFNEARSAFGTVGLKYATNQLALNVGAVLVF